MSIRIVVTTTLNDNLLYAKLVPLARSRTDLEIVLVTDRDGPPMPGVRWVWPRGFAAKFGRLGGRFLLLIREIFHPRTRLVMAYGVVTHGMFAAPLGKLRGVPVYLHFIAGKAEISFAHNPTISHNRYIPRMKNPRWIERWCVLTSRLADKIFVPGKATAEYLLKRGFHSDRIVSLHSAVDLERFQPSSCFRDIDVLVVAQIRGNKRPLFTLNVWSEIRRRRPQTRFCWLGQGPMDEEFQQRLDELGLRSCTEWSFTTDVTPYYRRARVFLLCSLSEGLSLGCMEAMACGVVPVTSDVGDMREVVRCGETGTWVPVDAGSTAYAEACLRFLEDEDAWTKASEACTDLIRKEHSFASATAQWSELLLPLAQGT